MQQAHIASRLGQDFFDAVEVFAVGGIAGILQRYGHCVQMPAPVSILLPRKV